MTTYYKYLNSDGTTPQGYGRWPMPVGDAPGEWLPEIAGELEACANGYHVMEARDLIDWSGPVLAEVEVTGDVLRSETIWE